MASRKTKSPASPTTAGPISAAELRMELQLEGIRSILSGGFLNLSASQVRSEKLLERIAKALEEQNRRMGSSNGHDHEGDNDHGH